MGLVTLTLDRIEVVTHRSKKLLHLVDGGFRNFAPFIILDGTGANAGQKGKLGPCHPGFLSDFPQNI